MTFRSHDKYKTDKWDDYNMKEKLYIEGQKWTLFHVAVCVSWIEVQLCRVKWTLCTVSCTVGWRRLPSLLSWPYCPAGHWPFSGATALSGGCWTFSSSLWPPWKESRPCSHSDTRSSALSGRRSRLPADSSCGASQRPGPSTFRPWRHCSWTELCPRGVLRHIVPP